MHSSIGSARVTPTLRRKARRGRCDDEVAMYGAFMALVASSLTEEDFALNKREQQVLHTIAVCGAGIEHGLDLRTVRKTHGGASGINSELL